MGGRPISPSRCRDTTLPRRDAAMPSEHRQQGVDCQELRLVPMCSSDERCGPKLLAVQLPRALLDPACALLPSPCPSPESFSAELPVQRSRLDVEREGAYFAPAPFRPRMRLASRRACVCRLGHAPRRSQNDEFGYSASCGRGRAAPPAAEGLDGRGESMALHSSAPTPPPCADRPMHSTRAQDAAHRASPIFRPSAIKHVV